ncbi:hypothetical protein HK102_012421, partial [Quaeritorhiza haematococci]
MAIIAHPGPISKIACTYDGAYLLTCGGPDSTINMWSINRTPLDVQVMIGNGSLNTLASTSTTSTNTSNTANGDDVVGNGNGNARAQDEKVERAGGKRGGERGGGKSSLVPFLRMLPGIDTLAVAAEDVAGVYKDLEDYFYYAQLKSQGEDTTARRQITDRVSLDQVPNIMQAMGFFPTEEGINDMINEIKYSKVTEGIVVPGAGG